MLGLLGAKKFSNDDLIKELLNPTLNLENLNKIKEKSKIDLNSLSLNGEPILIACCKKDLYNSCLWLLENKIDLELENNLKESAIFYTIYSKDSKLLETLLEFGANLNHLNNKNRTVLQESIHNANKKIVRFLIEKIDLNHKNKIGDTILHLDNCYKNLDLAIYLLNQGADPTIPNNKSISYLFFSATKGLEAFSFIKRAAELGFNLNIKNHENKNVQAMDNKNETIFFNITRSLDRDLIHYLLNNLEKLNLNRQNLEGLTVLSILILNGISNMDLIKLYIEKGANLEFKNRDNVCVVETLINIILHLENEQNLDLIYKENLNQNAQYKDILEALTKSYNLDFNRLNSKNKPLFFDCLLNFNFSLFKILRTKNLQINSTDINGNNIIFHLL